MYLPVACLMLYRVPFFKFFFGDGEVG